MAELVYSAPRATLLGNIITVSTLLLVFGSMLFSPFIIVATCYLIYCYPVVSVTITALLVGSLWAPLRPWKAFGHNFIFAHWRSYFSFQLKKEAPIPEKGSLFAIFPHGVFPLGLLLSAGCSEEAFPEHSPEAVRTALIASVFFYIPVISSMLTWLGCQPATHANVTSALQRGTAYLLPEGIAGVFLTSRKEELVYLSRRIGFVRLALQEGASLVPVYMFGQSHLLDVLPGAGSYLEALSRRLRVSLMFFFGSYYFPLPRARPLTAVVGTPIPCPRIPQPTQEQVLDYHARFCRALRQLFDENKADFGWSEKELIIV